MPVDTGTGATLYDAGARFYDPSSTGAHEFLGRDPLGGGYAYAGDAPASFADSEDAANRATDTGQGEKRHQPGQVPESGPPHDSLG